MVKIYILFIKILVCIKRILLLPNEENFASQIKIKWIDLINTLNKEINYSHSTEKEKNEILNLFEEIKINLNESQSSTSNESYFNLESLSDEYNKNSNIINSGRNSKYLKIEKLENIKKDINDNIKNTQIEIFIEDNSEILKETGLNNNSNLEVNKGKINEYQVESCSKNRNNFVSNEMLKSGSVNIFPKVSSKISKMINQNLENNLTRRNNISKINEKSFNFFNLNGKNIEEPKKCIYYF